VSVFIGRFTQDQELQSIYCAECSVILQKNTICDDYIISASYNCYNKPSMSDVYVCDIVTAIALLWTAPELLRIPRRIRNSEGTFSADFFSFGIVVYEVCYLTQPYAEQLTALGAPGNPFSLSTDFTSIASNANLWRSCTCSIYIYTL